MSLRTKSGKLLHPIGIGTWNISSERDLDPSTKYNARPIFGHEEAEIEALRYSFDKGQNHIDCAELYGGFYTDEVVGRALVGYPREDLYIADKLWKSSIEDGLVRPTVEKMLEKLGTDYIDLLCIHAPWFDTHWQAAIPQIDELIDEGVVRHFGVSNFMIEKMQEAMHIAKHPLAANQMNFNVLHKSEVPPAFREFCHQHDIQIVAYQPIKRQEVLTNETIQAIAVAHSATPAQSRALGFGSLAVREARGGLRAPGEIWLPAPKYRTLDPYVKTEDGIQHLSAVNEKYAELLGRHKERYTKDWIGTLNLDSEQWANLLRACATSEEFDRLLVDANRSAANSHMKPEQVRAYIRLAGQHALARGLSTQHIQLRDNVLDLKLVVSRSNY